MNLRLTDDTTDVTIGWQVFEDFKKTFSRKELEPLLRPDGTLDPESLHELLADHQGPEAHQCTHVRAIATVVRHRSDFK